MTDIADRISICSAKGLSQRMNEFRENGGRPVGGIISIEHEENSKHWLSPRVTDIPQTVFVISDGAHHLAKIPPWVSLASPPKEKHVSKALGFARNFPVDEQLFINCRKGLKRSTAIAYAIIARSYGPGREEEALQKVLEIRPFAVPSMPLIAIADRLLTRNGRMVEAVRNSPYVRENCDSDHFRLAARHLVMIGPVLRTIDQMTRRAVPAGSLRLQSAKIPSEKAQFQPFDFFLKAGYR